MTGHRHTGESACSHLTESTAVLKYSFTELLPRSQTRDYRNVGFAGFVGLRCSEALCVLFVSFIIFTFFKFKATSLQAEWFFIFQRDIFLFGQENVLKVRCSFLYSFDKHPADKYVTVKIFQHLAETIFFISLSHIQHNIHLNALCDVPFQCWLFEQQ